MNSLPFYTAGLFMNALNHDRGWSLADLSMGPTLLVLVMALSAPVMGQAFDRYGERGFILLGLIVQAAAFGALSQVDTLPAYWAAMGGMALLGAGCSSPAYLRIINREFDASKGAAFAITITGAALFSTLVPPLLQAVIGAHGWRAGYSSLGIAVLISVLPIMLLIGRRPRVTERASQRGSSFSYLQLFRSPAFLPLALAIATISVACPGLLIHFAPMLTRGGLTAQDAAWMVSLIGAAQIASRLSTGLLVDHYFAPRVAAVIMIASSLGLGLLAWGGISWAVAGAIGVGLAYGAEADLVGYFAGRYYPKPHFGRVFGSFYAVFLGGTAASPLLYGATVEYFGSYTPALVAAAAMLIVSALFFLMLPRFPANEEV
ncbi:MAG: MFS transporter [Sphingobium sp.]|uniref:MFS transporter n=1 Tax=Sphingobium sp. TaxID=1912891 RepID=UPI0029AC390B|nr:MFS transporter [Sphingobium sp.]MDX3910600.1 MFS transporter [Sphingobium sp.]